jgi:hypothetical protein
LTVKIEPLVTLPPSGLTTVNPLEVRVAPLATFTVTGSEVALPNPVEMTVTPLPVAMAVAPLSKPVPVSVTVWLLEPWPRDDGLADVTVGAALTVKIEPLAVVPSPLVTVTVRAPGVALPATVMTTLSVVGLVSVVELTVMPVPEKTVARLAPLTKLVPVSVKVCMLVP